MSMRYRLDDICCVSSAKRIFESEYVKQGIPFIRGLEITNGSLLKDETKFECYISRERYEQIVSKYGKPSKGDILITAVGTIGNLCYITKEMDFYFKDGNIIWFSNINQKCNSKWLYYWMKSQFFKEQIKYSMIGAVQKALTIDMLNKVTISLPPLPIQCKIAAVLTALDDKIALNKRINDKLEAMAKRLYDYWFVQFDFPDENGRPYKSSGGKMVWNETMKREIPEGWVVKNVKDVIKPIQRGISYSSEDIGSSEGIPLINLGCYSKQGDYRIGELKNYSGNYSFDDLVFPFDMLVACTDMTQNCDIIGRPIFVHKENASYLYTMDLAKLSPNDGTKMYLYYTLRTNFYHRYIKPFASGTNVKHLNVAGIENYSICIPDDNTNLKFEDTINKIKEKQLNGINETTRLTSLRDRLLPLLMNGQVEVK